MRKSDNAYILGVQYKIFVKNKADYPQLETCDGFVDTTSKIIIVKDASEFKDDIFANDNIGLYQNQILRHEVLHAFLFESGLDASSIPLNGCAWAINEEMVDWFAIQYPKIKKVYEELEAG